MTTPKDIIGRTIASMMLHRLHIADDGEADAITKEVLRKLEANGFVITQRRALPAVARKDPEDQKRHLIEEIEATTAQRTEDWIRDMQTARNGLRR